MIPEQSIISVGSLCMCLPTGEKEDYSIALFNPLHILIIDTLINELSFPDKDSGQ